MEEGSILCKGFLDMQGYFMSIVKEVLFEVERVAGVDVDVTDVVRELHAGVKGMYETAFGMTGGFDIDQGSGQGCVNGGNRAVLLAALIQ